MDIELYENEDKLVVEREFINDIIEKNAKKYFSINILKMIKKKRVLIETC